MQKQNITQTSSIQKQTLIKNFSSDTHILILQQNPQLQHISLKKMLHTIFKKEFFSITDCCLAQCRQLASS